MKNKRRPRNRSNRFSIVIPILTIVCIALITLTSSAYEENWNYNWGGIRKNIKDSLKIAEYQGMTSGFVGYSARSSMYEVKRRFWIMKNATEAELLQLTKYPGGTIKAIAYEGLIRNKDFKQKTALILEAMKDNKYLVHYQMGCEGWSMEMSEYLMTFVLKYRYPPPVENNFGISTSDSKDILEAYRQFKSYNSVEY